MARRDRCAIMRHTQASGLANHCSWAACIDPARCKVVKFVHHGSFYNLFDVDADVGLRVGLNLSGRREANMWKVGCTRDAFPAWATKVLALGYSVGRVEEIHSGGVPEGGGAGARRGRKTPGSLVKRTLVRIYTPGTAVDPYFQDDSSLDSRAFVSLVEAPGGEMGACVVNCSLGCWAVGQLLDTPSRTALATLLLRYKPNEVVTAKGSLSPVTTAVVTRFAGVLAGGGAAAATAAAAPITYVPLTGNSRHWEGQRLPAFSVSSHAAASQGLTSEHEGCSAAPDATAFITEVLGAVNEGSFGDGRGSGGDEAGNSGRPGTHASMERG
ncbi:hypothetical protein Vretimale_19495, partial [Volvox reticuliferus]